MARVMDEPHCQLTALTLTETKDAKSAGLKNIQLKFIKGRRERTSIEELPAVKRRVELGPALGDLAHGGSRLLDEREGALHPRVVPIDANSN